MNLSVINNDNSSFSAKNDLNLYTRRLSKMAKIVIPEIILGDKEIPTIIMLHIFLMSESGHFTIKIRYSELQLNLGKQFCLFLVEALSAGKMHVCFLSAKETHTHTHTRSNRKSRCTFQETPQWISHHCQELFNTSLTCTTTTWMDTWSGSLIGARKYCDNATRRWSIATRLLAWTAEIDIKSTSHKLQSN